jgi:electron transport complex protein RnfD
MSKSTLEIRSAPHVKGVRTVEQIMRHVVYSLLPICIFFIYQYGISALALIAVVTGTCVWTERLFAHTGTQSGNIADYSSVITGLLLALTLPPGFPLWMAAVAAFVSIALGKALFGGIGFNVFNPALVGRAFVQAAFPTAIATYTPSFLIGRGSEFIPSSLALPLMQPANTDAWLQAMKLDGWTGATPLAQWKFEHSLVAVGDLLTSLGSQLPVGPSPVLIALCGLYLALRRFMDWRVPTAVFGGAALTAWILFLLDPTKFPTPGFSLLSGGLALGAVYMATDMATSPVTPKGMWVYGALIGFLTVVIRNFSGLPEGVMYAILLGNAVTPLIEKVTQPTPFGKSASKKARRAASYPLHPGYISRDGDVQERDKS